MTTVKKSIIKLFVHVEKSYQLAGTVVTAEVAAQLVIELWHQKRNVVDALTIINSFTALPHVSASFASTVIMPRKKFNSSSFHINTA